MAPYNATGLVDDLNIWRNGGMIVPAVMTLICFVCTAVSLTVSGFICLRDREAQEESDNKAKHHKEQEFISRVLGLFYKIRTSNIFRIQEIMQDLNGERPVWIGRKSEIVLNLEYYGIYLTEREKTNLSSAQEVFEIDCESLFYFELERFSKAQAIYGPNVLTYFESIQQDGCAFPREFYPDINAVFSSDIIYNVFTEMQIFTELFVLLATGIDLEIINVHSIPHQFRHSKLGNELSLIKDFLYNYYLRVFPEERSSAVVMRKLPELPIIYEPFIDEDKDKTETIETIIEESEEVIDDGIPQRKRSIKEVQPRSSTTFQGSQPLGTSSRRTSTASTSSLKPGPSTGSTTKKRLSISLGKQKLKLLNAYKTIAERVRERPSYTGEEVGEEESTAEDYSEEQADFDTSFDSRQVRFKNDGSSADPSPRREPQIRTKRKTIKKKIMEKRAVPETAAQQEALLEEMRQRYKAPVRRENFPRKRGRLFKEEVLSHNAFTYMVARVIAFLQEKGHLSDKEINDTKYLAVDRNFII